MCKHGINLRLYVNVILTIIIVYDIDPILSRHRRNFCSFFRLEEVKSEIWILIKVSRDTLFANQNKKLSINRNSPPIDNASASLQNRN